MDKKDKVIVILAFSCLVLLVATISSVVWATDGVHLEDIVDQDIVDEAISMTEAETNTEYEMFPVYRDTGEWVGFLGCINQSGQYMYLGNNRYPSIFQEVDN